MSAHAATLVCHSHGKPTPAAQWNDGFDLSKSAETVIALSSIIQFPRNAEVFGEDEPADYVYVVLSGVVRICKLLGDGRRQIETFCLAGDAFGWETGDRNRFSAEAVSECRLARIKRSILFARASDDPELSQAMWLLTMAELHRAQEHLLLLGRKTAHERVATFLIDLARRSCRAGANANEVTLAMSRQDIADYLGLTIETVSRTLTSLEESALISLVSSRRIVLKDRCGLRRLDA
ncbi:MAG: transcriptional regulator [Rhizobiales bacterium 32-66-8]|nr:MAG: transcriptional regulator [Rhizobiales bacterium 32-66-8]